MIATCAIRASGPGHWRDCATSRAGNSWPSARWVATRSSRFRRTTCESMRRITGTEERYGKLLAANKCRQALVDAAAFPAEVLQNSPRQFVRQDEAQLNNLLGQARRLAAAIGPQIDKLYETLAAAESDRERLTAPVGRQGMTWRLAAPWPPRPVATATTRC